MAERGQADHELFRSFRQGDPEAFRRLVEPHRRAVQACIGRHLDRRLHRRVSVADLVQDAQLIAFERRGEFRGEDPRGLRRWMIGIAINLVRRAVHEHLGTGKRTLEREVTRGERVSMHGYPSPDGTPSRAVAARELAALAAEARVVLSREEDKILRLVHDERLSLAQVAERLERPQDQVRKQHARAMRRFGDAFRRLQGGSDDTVRGR